MRDALAKLGSDANKINPLVRFILMLSEKPDQFSGPIFGFTEKKHLSSPFQTVFF
jgi:hypothetical protein